MATDEKGYTLTPEEIKVAELLNNASVRINEIDDRMANPDKYMRPAPKPTWMGSTQPTSAEKEHFKKTQEYYRTSVKEETRDQAAKLVEKSPVDVQVRTFAQVDSWSEHHTTDKERAEALQGAGKNDISKSQDASMRLLQEEKSKSGESSFKPSYLRTPDENGASGFDKDADKDHVADRAPEIDRDDD